MAEESHNLGININVTGNYQQQLNNLERNVRSVNTRLRGMRQNIQQVNQATGTGTSEANRSMQDMEDTTSNLSTEMDDLANKQNEAAEGMSKIQGNAGKSRQAQEEARRSTDNWMSAYSESISIAARSVAIWGAATTAIYGTKRALEDIHETLKQVNTEMVAVRRVMNDAITDFQEMEAAAAGLGVEYAENVDAVVQSMVGWARQGYEQVEVLELTEAALLATNVAQMEAAESVDLLTSAILQFNKDAAEATEVVDRLNEVANNYAVTAQDLATAVRESGAAAHSAGVTMDELIGITASLSATTAKSGSRIGRSLRTMFSRMMGDAEDGGEALGQVEVALNQVGIALRETEEDYRDIMDVLTDLSVQWDQLDDVMQANIARAMGGRRRYSDVLSLMENWDMAIEATETSMDSLNSAIEENETYMESMEAQWMQARATFEELSVIIGEIGLEQWSIRAANAVEGFIGEIQNLVVGMNHLEQETNALSIALRGLAIGVIYNTAIPAVKALGTALSALLAHPVVAGVTAMTAAFVAYSRSVGESQQAVEEAADRQEMLSDAMERTHELSRIEMQQVEDTIDHYRGLISTYYEAEQALSEYSQVERELSEPYFWEEIPVISGAISGVADTVTGLMADMEEALGVPEDWAVFSAYRQLQEIVDEVRSDMDAHSDSIEQLRNEFSELDDAYDDNEEFLSALTEELREYAEIVDRSVAMTEVEVNAMEERLRQRARESRMIREQQRRYEELASIEDRTTDQTLEMRQIMAELSEEYIELAKASDEEFGPALQRIVDDLDEFEEGSETLEEAIDDLENRFEDMEEAEQELLETQQELGAELAEVKNELDELEEGDPRWAELAEEADELQHRLETVNEQLIIAVQLQGDIKELIAEFGEGLAADEVEEIYSHFQEALGVLWEVGEELFEIERQIQDIGSELEAEIEFAEWLADIKDLRPHEELDLMSDATRDASEEMQGLAQDVFQLGQALESAETEAEMREVLEDMESLEDIEDLDFDVQGFIEEFEQQFGDEAGDVSFDEFREELLEELGYQIEELEARTRGLELEFTEEFIDYIMDGRELADLTDEELSEVITAIEEFEEEFGIAPELQIKEDEISTEQMHRDLVELLEDTFEDIDDEIDVDLQAPDFEDAEDTQEKLGIIRSSIASTQFELADLAATDIDIDDVGIEELEETLSTLEDRSESTVAIIEELEQAIEEAEDEETEENLRGIIQAIERTLDLTEDQIDAIEEEIRMNEIRNEVREEELDLMGEYEREVAMLTERIADLNEMEEEVSDEELLERIQNVTGELEAQKEIYEALVEAQELDIDTDVEDELGVADTVERLDELEGGFERAKERIQEMTEEELDSEQLEEIMEILGLSEEDFEEGIQALEENLERIAGNWADAFTDGFTSAIDGMEDGVEDLGDALTAAAGGFAEVMADEELFVATMETLDLTFMDTVSDWDSIVEEPIFQGAQAGLQAASDLLDEDGSIGRSITTALGAGIGAAFGAPQVGAAIGDFVGQIGEALGGEVEGREEMEEAVDINEQIEENEDALQEFGYQYDAIMADFEDTAGTWQSFWGGEDWDVENLDKAKEDLEEMERLGERLEARVGDFESSLADAITGAFSYQDAYREFRTSVGEAMIDAALDAMIESQVMQEHFQQLSGQIENAIADGYISDEELSNIENTVDAIMREADEVRPLLDQIQEAMGVDVEGRTRQTFQAGATSSITYHNDYIVQAGAFMGNESEAREFAKMLAPYIHKEVERAMGR